MQVKYLSITLFSLLFSLLLPSLSQAQQVSIPDANLAAAIREEIGNSITRQTLLNLTRLDAPNSGITDLTGLEHARNLTVLELGREWIDGQGPVNSNTISDFLPIAGLTRLTSLNLSYCGLSDVSFLSGLTQLTSLQLYENSISDISPLAKLKTLTTLDIWDNSISDIAPLAELKKLTFLEFSDNSISDISALAECKQLTYLYILNNSISDITPLAELKKLYGLQLDGNTISDISPLAELTKLGWLAIRRNSISDVSPLAKLTKLTSLDLINNNISDVSPLIKLNLPGTEWDSTGLDITGNPLSYASINTHIPAMQARGIEVAFDDRTPTTLVKISGIAQEGPVNTALPLPFVAEVQDEQNRPFAGVPVTFRITAGSGRLNAATTTDTTGRVSARLTTGQTAGTTTVRVTATDVSQPVQFTATAIPHSAPVPIPDVNLRAKIAETLRKPLGETITFADMLQLRTLTANNAGILDLTGLQYASNLTSLTLNDNSISDVSPVAGLPRLTRLDLMNNWISDVSPVAGLPRLTRLDLMNNWISDVSPLAGLNNLQRLFLQDNPLSDTSIQTHIPQLQAAGVNVRFDSVSTPHEGPIVRLIYFLPRDRQPQPDINAKMDALIKEAQQVHAQQMESQGFERKTFTFETDARGNAVVYHVIGKYGDTYYHNQALKVWEEIDAHFDRSTNIYLAALDTSTEDLDGFACGYGSARGSSGGEALIPASGGCFEGIGVTVHELGHAFGLQHDFRSDATAKRIPPYSEPMSSSFCAAEWLDVHPAFNANQITTDTRTTVEMLPPSLASSPNAIRLRFKVTDPDGLHQVQFLTPEVDYTGSLLACKRLNGVTSSTVEFVTTELTPKNESVHLQVMDVNGNFIISQRFPVDIASLLPPARVVRIPDPNLAAALREEIGDSITTHTLLNLTRLEAPNRGIKNLTGLEHAHNLRELNLGGEYNSNWERVNSNAISDFSPIAGLPQLTHLNLSDFGLSDVSLLSGLTQLERLNLDSNIISDISALAKLTQLTDLDLADNIISDISALAELTQLTDLRIGSNIVSDISALAELKNLVYLNLYDNAISDISALAELTQLTDLVLWDNTISDVSPLAKLTQLTDLDLGDNSISDISALAELTQLTDLRIGRNIVSDISALAELKNLIYLDLYGNIISDISSLAELTQLTQLRLNNNTISDVSPIVGLNLTGTEWDRVGLDIRSNPLNAASINTHIPAMQAKGIEVAFGDTEIAQEPVVQGGAKIEGPWLWMIVPTEQGADTSTAASGKDWLAAASKGSVTEVQIATNGATEGERLQNRVWTLSRLAPTGGNNIGEIVNTIGWARGYIDYHVAYGSIVLNSPREQKTRMYVGSDDNHKVWLNGELVRERLDWHWAHDYQESFSVTLKQGKNVLLVAIENLGGPWGGYFGFASDAEYTIPTQVALPAWDVNEDGITDATDVLLVTAALGQEPPENPRLDVNGDGVVDAKDLALVVEHLGEGDAPAAASRLAQPLGFTLENVEHTLNILRAADDGTLTFKRGIENLEQLLTRFVPERTALLHNYPNPFNPETWIPYQLAKPAEVTLRIYAVNGAVVRTLALGHQPAGVYRIRSRAAYWDGRNAVGEPVASGLYFYTLTAGDFSATRKMLIRK